MEVKRRKRRVLSRRDRFLEFSSTFEAFGHLFKSSARESLLEMERNEVFAKVCLGLSQVCKMLAGEQVEENYVGVLVRSLDREQQEHPEWFEDIIFPDLPAAIPDIQMRIGLGSNKVLIEVTKSNPNGENTDLMPADYKRIKKLYGDEGILYLGWA